MEFCCLSEALKSPLVHLRRFRSVSIRSFHFPTKGSMPDDRYLPGSPSRRRVREVRSHLWRYGIRPKGESWRLAWHWAFDIACSYFHFRWPLPSEIASQYVVLMLCEMKDSRSLKLPFRADQVQPEAVQQLIVDEPLIEVPQLKSVED